MRERECPLIAADDWTFYNGFPVPRWLEELLGRDIVEIYGERYGTTQWFAHWWCIPCALELEHRREPIQSLRQLRRVAARVRAIGYDFGPAIRLSEDITQEHWARYLDAAHCVSQWSADLLRRQMEAMPAAVQLRKELEAKQLPHGAAANLALMRVIVGLENRFKDDD